MLVDVKNTINKMKPPTSKIWVTETLYNLNGPVIAESGSNHDLPTYYALKSSPCVPPKHLPTFYSLNRRPCVRQCYLLVCGRRRGGAVVLVCLESSGSWWPADQLCQLGLGSY